ncbi:MAG: hypothetical protein KUG77_29615, partial [Nannocystaceae bacterium]|nr:hypothetical protein [Nannocystaceae bacterium]
DARQARLFNSMMSRADPVALDVVLSKVAGGLPPKSLGAFVDNARSYPREEYAPALRRYARYRKATIRARALVALAAIDRDFGGEAALLAMSDPTTEIRVLGVELALAYTAPHVEEALMRLLARDEAVAKIVRKARH